MAQPSRLPSPTAFATACLPLCPQEVISTLGDAAGEGEPAGEGKKKKEKKEKKEK